MKKVRAFHSVARGESHKVKDIPCQDAALHFEDSKKGIYIAAVSDGHGSEMHFMSEHGSRIAVNVAIHVIRDFLAVPESLQLAVPYANSGILSNDEDESSVDEAKGETKQNEQYWLLNGLSSSIISNWNSSIGKHWQENTHSHEYMKERNVPDEAILNYSRGISIEHAYGCTLIVFAETPDFWFAFQIGDGTCIAFNKAGDSYQPIPEDTRFSGSRTASLCNDDAITSFRYCYGNDNLPVAVFLGSDGLDGIYGTMYDYSLPQLTRLYSSIIRTFNVKEFEETVREIDINLPQLSTKGVTRDDMSLAAILDLDEIRKLQKILIKKELDYLEKELALKEEQYDSLKKNEQDKIIETEQKKEELNNLENELQRSELELRSIQKNLDNAAKEREASATKRDKTKNEVNPSVKDFFTGVLASISSGK